MNGQKLLIVSTHSFVDLITNSSSELFVCDTKKSLDAVKELLATLLKNHDAIEGETHVFDNVFGKIESTPYSFQWYDVPEEVRNTYEYFHEYCSFGRSKYDMFYTSNTNPEMEVLRNQEREIEKKHKTREEGLYEQDKEEYNRRWAAATKETNALWTDYGARVLASENALFLEFLTQNKFSAADMKLAKAAGDKAVEQHRKSKRGRYSWQRKEFPTKKLNDAYETFQEWSSWGITAKKGDIFIYSASDNTVPYLLMDTISSYLSAEQYHLG